MLTKEQIRFVRETIAPHTGPILSLYVDVNPAKPENRKKGWLIRAKNSIKQLDMPDQLQEKVLEILWEDRPEANTLVMFGAEEFVERFDLHVELPVVDLAHGRIEARWGKPYVAPLLYALDEYERTGILHLEEGRWAFYEVFLGEIARAEDAFESTDPEKWAELRQYLPELYRGFLKQRLSTHPDRFSYRVESWVHRFLKRLGQLVQEVVERQAISRLVLLGPEAETKFFEQYLPRALRQRIVAHVSDLPRKDASPREILHLVQPHLEAAERAQENALLDRIREQPGIWGVDKTLEALHMGRVSVLVAPWSLDQTVWQCDHGWTAPTADRLRQFCLEHEPVQVRLQDVIADLAADFGARLEFVRGEPEQRLKREFGGLAGLLRW